MTEVLFDIETNGLYREATTVHCISIKQIVDGNPQPTKVYTSEDIKGSDGDLDEAYDILMKADVLIGHNIIKFDLPTLKKLNWMFTPSAKLLDTLILSKLKYPNLAMIDGNRKKFPSKLVGSHSLKAWGYRMKVYKGDFGTEAEQWEVLTPEMVEYCRQDTEVTYALYTRLVNSGLPPQQAIDIEQDFAAIISRQEKYGVYFNYEEAQKLHLEILSESVAIQEQMEATFGYVVKRGEVMTPKTNRTMIKGQPCPVRYYKDVPYCKVDFVPFNPGSRDQIVTVLQDKYNWKPIEYTDKGTPIVNESVLASLDYPEAQLLNKYLTIKKLLGQLSDGNNAWLKCVDPTTNRIYGSVDTLGAVSRRCTHNRPNMAQVPSNRAFKGHECRALFCVPKGKKLVGCDMSGLELRVFAHYLARFDKGEYANIILTGDIHTYNQKAAGLPTRDNAKTFIYGTLYGAGDGKVGEIVGKDANEGKRLKDMFKRNVPSYATLIEQIQTVYKKTKTLKALDGNPYFIRSSHSALNTLLQGAGALVCKQWLIETDKELQYRGYKPGYDYEFVLNIHDEFQIECNEDIAQEASEVAKLCATRAGEYFKFRIKLEGDAKIGRNWAETH